MSLNGKIRRILLKAVLLISITGYISSHISVEAQTKSNSKMQVILQTAYVVNAGSKVSFIRSDRQDSTWQVSLAKNGRRTSILTTKGAELHFTPADDGSYLVSSKTANESEITTYFEAIRLRAPLIERRSKNVTSYSPTMKGTAENGMVSLNDTLRYSVSITPSIKDEYISWFESPDIKIGQKAILEREANKTGRFSIYAKVTVGNDSLKSIPAVQTTIGNLRVSSLKGIDINGNVLPDSTTLSVGTKLEYACQVEPTDLSPADIHWEISTANKDYDAGKGLSGSSIIREVGRFSLVCYAGPYQSKSVELSAVGAYFTNKDNRQISYLNIAKWADAFNTDGSIKKDFITAEPDRFSVGIIDPSGKYTDSIKLRSTYKGKVIDDWAEHPLVSKDSSHISGAFILITDDVDKVANTTLKAVLEGEIEVMYKDTICGKIQIGASPTALGDDAIRTVDLNIIILKDKGKPITTETAIRNRVLLANERWAQAGIRFYISNISFTEHTSNVMLISGTANGSSYEGRGYIGFFLNNIEVKCFTGFGDTPATTANKLIGAVPKGFKGKILGPITKGNTNNVAFSIYTEDNTPIHIRADNKLTDTGQYLTVGEVDLSDGVATTIIPTELSLEEFALSTLKDNDHTTVDIIVVNELKSPQGDILLKTYPYEWYVGQMDNTILLSAKTSGATGEYPFALAKALGHILFRSLYTSNNPHSLMYINSGKENKVEADKRLTAEEIKTIRQTFTLIDDRVNILKRK